MEHKKKHSTQNGMTLVLWRRLQEGSFILLTAFSVFLLVSLLSYNNIDPGWSKTTAYQTIHNATGKAGAFFSDLFFYLFGYMAYLFPLMIAYGGFRLFQTRDEIGHFYYLFWLLRVSGFILAMVSGCGLGSLHFQGFAENLPADSGGILGSSLVDALVPSFGGSGCTLLLLAGFLAGITLTTGLSWFGLLDKIRIQTLHFMFLCREKIPVLYSQFKNKWKPASLSLNLPKPIKPQTQKRVAPTLSADNPNAITERKILAPKPPQPATLPVIIRAETPVREKTFKSALAPSLILPDVSLLEENKEQDKVLGFSTQKLESLSREVESRLLEFGIPVTVVGVYPGPVITRFELELAAGIKVSKITTLSKDLARSLSVSRVRVVEVIPGKSVVGLEIPNVERECVRLREILESSQYQESHSPLTLALGKDIAGIPTVVNLAKMPHLLVAGTTGSGKSVGINAMLLSLLYKATPDEVRLILIDPKMLELSIYDGIPHLLTPVVTDMKDAANALRWCVGEMERRYQLMAALGVRNIIGYNRKIADAENEKKPLLHPLWKPEQGGEQPVLEKLSYIVVIIDEFADMMMVVGKKVEELIARIAQKARAAGIHMILATQRPSVDVITGLIKANVPTRIAYQVSSRIDSRTILDQQGAEQLLGYGDMLYLAPGTGIPIRIHGAFVSDEEVHNVVKALKMLGEPDYAEDILGGGNGFSGGGLSAFGGENGMEEEEDALYVQAVQIVQESRRASISHLQRRLKIGYNRAARLIETMELHGIVSPMQSNGNREVLGYSSPDSEEM